MVRGDGFTSLYVTHNSRCCKLAKVPRGITAALKIDSIESVMQNREDELKLCWIISGALFACCFVLRSTSNRVDSDIANI